MKTVLKSFRLPLDCVEFIERKSKEENVPQAQIVTNALKKGMDFQSEWQAALEFLNKDEKYKNEQLEMAEENYE